MAHLVIRQTTSGADSDAPSDDSLIGTPGHCDTGNEYDGKMGLRISSIFVIFIGSFIGACFPIFSRRNSGAKLPEWTFFAAKFFGSGVIVATAFIHLLAPANEALGDPCLTGPITEYSWVEGIVLMTIFVLFFIEILVMRYADFGDGHDHGHSHSHSHAIDDVNTHGSNSPSSNPLDLKDESQNHHHLHPHDNSNGDGLHLDNRASNIPGEDHLGHSRMHTDNTAAEVAGSIPENYAAQMTAIFILEFGVIFHSVFIGLTLAVSGEEFDTLYIVLVFHQTFEGLGLGTRLSLAPWPRKRRWTPYAMAIGYALSTPIAIAIGLGVRNAYPPGSQTTLIVNGVFDSISAGILIYTGLVELMAHEFMFSPTMQRASIGRVLSAFGIMCLGAGLMALLGKWA
ncbi:ZIP zinc/iron transport family [Aulographum hederae CBS 113979]|uniref:ZIP zinc/iron transport family n=1 Tax=Aulographum hederae CBS 113979 TaxID=1176131 RepID=A0A6G1GIV6_9PEZI|nr:ZIP zinc/iron transport family [Aulographum hederae CBS 113979]